MKKYHVAFEVSGYESHDVGASNEAEAVLEAKSRSDLANLGCELKLSEVYEITP